MFTITAGIALVVAFAPAPLERREDVRAEQKRQQQLDERDRLERAWEMRLPEFSTCRATAAQVLETSRAILAVELLLAQKPIQLSVAHEEHAERMIELEELARYLHAVGRLSMEDYLAVQDAMHMADAASRGAGGKSVEALRAAQNGRAYHR